MASPRRVSLTGRIFPAAMFLFFMIICGCGSTTEEAADPTAQASGTVSVEGKAVGRGEVCFYSLASGATGQTALSKGGKFQLESPLVPGDYAVYLIGASNVPEKFLSETSSDYKVTLKEGANDLTINLQ